MYRMIRSDIYRNSQGELDIDYYNQNHKGISTHRGKGKDKINPGEPYVTQDNLLNGHTVYSVYAFSGDDYVSIFKDIKQGKMDRDLYVDWLQFTAQYIWDAILSHNKPDIIAIPQSSSSLVEDLAKEVSKISNIEYLPHAFIKNSVDEIKLEIPSNIKVPQDALLSAQKALDRIKQTGVFEAKAVPKRMLKFFRNVYRNDEEYIDLLEGKKVAVLDDSMTSKATMFNIFDVCDYIYKTKEVYGVTIFKKTGSKKH